jgi:hypothetical protein
MVLGASTLSLNELHPKYIQNILLFIFGTFDIYVNYNIIISLYQ